MQSKEIVNKHMTLSVYTLVQQVAYDQSGRYQSYHRPWRREVDMGSMISVWDAMCRVIRENLVEGRAVHIRGIGTFGFKKIPQPNAHAGCVFKPSFKVDENLVTRAELYEAEVTPRVPTYSGSIWGAFPQPIFLNPVTVGRRCGSDPGYVVAVLKDVFLRLTDILSEPYPHLVGLDFHFGRLIYDGPTKKIRFAFNKNMREAANAMADMATTHNKHTHLHRTFAQSHREQLFNMTRSLRTPGPRKTPVPWQNFDTTGRRLPALLQHAAHRPSTAPNSPRSIRSRHSHVERLSSARGSSRAEAKRIAAAETARVGSPRPTPPRSARGAARSPRVASPRA